MKTSHLRRFGAAVLAAAAIVAACTTAPITGRRQLIVTSETEEAALGLQAYQEVTAGPVISKNKEWTAMVERVGKRIAAVAERPDFQWEFKLIAENTVNAFCLPGGKVAFYEGIMPVCATDAGVAVVMGHEVGHAIARHGGERMTDSMLVEGGASIVASILGGKDPQKQQMAAAALGAGAKYGMLMPFGRKQETEADEIGIILMAKAGYDPREAAKFWQRMIEATGGSGQPEFLSTHPAPENRIAHLKSLEPKALEHFAAAKK